MNSGSKKSHHFLRWVVFLVLFGAISGPFVSKLLWGYWWNAPIVRIPENRGLEAVSLFYVNPTLEVASPDDRNSVIESHLRGCEIPRGDCNAGRILSKLGGRALEALPPLPDQDVFGIVKIAHAVSPVNFFGPDKTGGGFAIRFSGNIWLITFSSSELSNDTHGYVELLLDNSTAAPIAMENAWYYYDVAGVEFLSPPVLVIGGITVSFILGGGVLLMLYVVRHWKRRVA